MLRIVRLSLYLAALLAAWAALLAADLDEFHHLLVLLVSCAEPSATPSLDGAVDGSMRSVPYK